VLIVLTIPFIGAVCTGSVRRLQRMYVEEARHRAGS
jgi:hypothetical protein